MGHEKIYYFPNESNNLMEFFESISFDLISTARDNNVKIDNDTKIKVKVEFEVVNNSKMSE